MNEEPLSAQEILTKLRKINLLMPSYENGRILSSMCTKPPDIAKQAYFIFLEKNAGDRNISHELLKLEKEVIKEIGLLLSNKKADGHIVSGGTEANIIALWIAKKLKRVKKPEIVLPSSAHISFKKAADLMGLSIKEAPLDSEFRVDVSTLENLLSDKTIAIIANAGTPDLGVVDPIEELGKMASERDIFLHVDAAFGGFVLPFLKELGYSVAKFDFSVRAVQSITVDPHKMGLAPIPAGGILLRDEGLLRCIKIQVPYIKTHHTTILGTRSGASIAAVWATIKSLGKSGYKRIVKDCMQNTLKLMSELEKIEGITFPVKPVMNILGFWYKNRKLTRKLTRLLEERGWIVTVGSYGQTRLIIMPHIKELHLEQFISDVKECVRKIS